MRVQTTAYDQDCLLIFEPGSVCSFADVKRYPESFPTYVKIVAWIESFIVRPNKELGREGPVCPRVRECVDRNLIKFATMRTKEATANEAVLKCEALSGGFYALFPNCDDRTLSSLVILFPDVESNEASEFIDGGHGRLRKIFVKNGLMLGDFLRKTQDCAFSNRPLEPCARQSPCSPYARSPNMIINFSFGRSFR